jgi:hypothetical protein
MSLPGQPCIPTPTPCMADVIFEMDKHLIHDGRAELSLYSPSQLHDPVNPTTLIFVTLNLLLWFITLVVNLTSRFREIPLIIQHHKPCQISIFYNIRCFTLPQYVHQFMSLRIHNHSMHIDSLADSFFGRTVLFPHPIKQHRPGISILRNMSISTTLPSIVCHMMQCSENDSTGHLTGRLPKSLPLSHDI